MKRKTLYTLVLIVSITILNGCFHKQKNPLNELQSLLNEQEAAEKYSFTGTATYVLDDQFQYEFDWMGNVTSELNYAEFSMKSNSKTNKEQNITILYDGTTTYTHLPAVNQENEWITTTSLRWTIDRMDNIFVNELIQQQIKDSAVNVQTAIENDDGKRIIQFTPDEDDVQRWLDQLEQRNESIPTAQRLLFHSTDPISNMDLVQIRLHFDENNQLFAYELDFKTENTSLYMKQTYDRLQLIPQRSLPDQKQHILLPVDQIWENILMENDHSQPQPYDNFEDSIDLIVDYTYEDEDRQQIIRLIKTSLQALIDRENEPTLAELFGEIWSSDRKFRFISIEDLTHKTIRGQTRVAVVYEYMDKEHIHPTLSGFVFTLVKDGAGNWHIQSID